MDEAMMAVSEYMAQHQGPHSMNRPLTGRTAQRAMALMTEAGLQPGAEEVGKGKHKRSVPTYPRAILDQAFREARA